MIRPTSKIQHTFLLNDYQVFKGACQNTMKPFGQPVSAGHEAHLLIEDDRSKLPLSETALYCIHQRSENRILTIVEANENVVVMPKPKAAPSRLPLPKAA